ncbi:hypothetical protein Tco_0371678 [Tanacetum coccineum]
MGLKVKNSFAVRNFEEKWDLKLHKNEVEMDGSYRGGWVSYAWSDACSWMSGYPFCDVAAAGRFNLHSRGKCNSLYETSRLTVSVMPFLDALVIITL